MGRRAPCGAYSSRASRRTHAWLPSARTAMPTMLVVLPACEPPLARVLCMSCVLRTWRCRMRTSRNSELMWGIETPDPGEPTRLLAEGDTLEVGDVCLQVIETPGHTPGGIVLFAATEQGNIAFVGDTLFPGQPRPHRSFRRRRGGDSALALQARPASPARYRLPDRPWRFDHHGTRAHAEPVHAGVAL